MKAQISSFSFLGRALVRVTAVFALGLALSVSAQASLVSGWTSSTGGGVLTNVSAGSVTYANPTGLSAIYSTLNGGAGYTLGVGDSLSFTGSVVNPSTTSLTWGQTGFRQMLMYTTTPTTLTGWSGYYIGNSCPASATDYVTPFERGASGNWYSATGASTFASAATQAVGSGVTYGSSMAHGTYDFSFTITRDTASTLQFTWSLVETMDASGAAVSGVYSFTGSVTDTTPSANTFNQVGLMLSTGAYSGTVTLSNLDVTYTAVPEPASVAMMAAGIMGLLWIQKRRKS